MTTTEQIQTAAFALGAVEHDDFYGDDPAAYSYTIDGDTLTVYVPVKDTDKARNAFAIVDLTVEIAAVKPPRRTTSQDRFYSSYSV